MSIASDSQVVDALQEPSNLESVLRALGCSTATEGREFGAGHDAFINCPMPDHADKHPSCEVLARKGMLCCYSCGGTVATHGGASREGTILPLDLVIEHGRASDRGEAAKWIEGVLGLEAKRREDLDRREVVHNPGLSVRQYLALKHLSDETVRRFDLSDVRIWEDPDRARKGYRSEFVKGYYGAVMMPNDAPGIGPQHFAYRPRVRNVFGARWPAKVQVATGNTAVPGGNAPLEIAFSRASADNADELAHIQRCYGYPQLAPAPPESMLHRILFLYEGESDVHASHDMGITACLGLPGVGAFRSNVGDLLDAIERLEPGGSAADWTIAVWSEPGEAGESLPAKITSSVAAYCTENFIAEPRVAALLHSSLAPIPVSTLPGSPAEHAKDPCELVGRLLPLHRGDATAARAQAGQIITEAAFVSLGRSAIELDPQAPTAAVAPAAAVAAAPIPQGALTRDDDPWESMGCEETGQIQPPSPLDCPTVLEHLQRTYERGPDGWIEVTEDKDGNVKRPSVSTIFFISEVQDVDGEDHVVLAAPRAHSGVLQYSKVPRSDLGDPRKIVAALGAIGATVAMRMGNQAGHIASALSDRWLRNHDIVKLPATTGWDGRAGIGAFGGIDTEPLTQFGGWMYRANLARRQAAASIEGGVEAQAREWWERGAMPLIAEPEEILPQHAASILAIGAAAAAPLIGPLGDLGVTVSPVLWIAGMGGGGKSVIQKLCATIFAPTTASLDGQIAFSANADISRAALGARVDSCRDLPMLLDDVTQMQPKHGSRSNGEDARIESAVDVGMQIFNRKPIERANRDGGSRLTRAFRSSAIFSAEYNMHSDTSKAVITAGHRRRISTIEARPMTDRGLGQAYAETVNYLAQSVGGAPGELLVARVRELTRSKQLNGPFQHVRASMAAMPQSSGVTLTQRECLAMIVLGFVLVATTSGDWEFEHAVTRTLTQLAPYMEAGAVAGGATRDDELASSERIVHAVEELLQSQPARWDQPHDAHTIFSVPNQGFIGKILRGYHTDDHLKVILFQDALLLLKGRFGITEQMISQAKADGVMAGAHQYRDHDNRRKRGLMIRVPLPEPTLDDPNAPHVEGPDQDPFNLARTMFTRSEVHVPGMAAAEATEDDDYQENDMLLEKAGLVLDVGRDFDSIEDPSVRQFEMNKAHFGKAVSMARTLRKVHGQAFASKWIVESVTSAMMSAYDSGSAVSRTVYDKEGMTMKGVRFIWGTTGGFYAVQNAAEVLADEASKKKLFEAIEQDIAREIAALQEFYAKAAEADPQGELGAPIEVLDLPAKDDPKLEAIRQLGWEVARKQWADMWQATAAANHSLDPAASRAYHELKVKHVRIHLMARLACPEWFIVDEAALVAA